MVPFSIAWNSKNPIGKYLWLLVYLSIFYEWIHCCMQSLLRKGWNKNHKNNKQALDTYFIHGWVPENFNIPDTWGQASLDFLSAVCHRREASQNIKVKACLNYFMNAVPSNYFTCFPRCLLCIYYHVGALVYLCVQILWWNVCLFKYIHRLVNF